MVTQWQDSYGVRIRDLDPTRDFSLQQHPPDPSLEQAIFARLRSALADSQERAMGELVQIAVTNCHADSAGISLEEQNSNGELQFRWVAAAGSFLRYLNGTTPRFYSPCGTCLDRGVPQRYAVWQPYYSFLGVDAQPILDGLLIPWRASPQQGTLWIVSHSSKDAFTTIDFGIMRKLADFVSENMARSPH